MQNHIHKILFCFVSSHKSFTEGQKARFIFTFNKAENINRGILIMRIIEISYHLGYILQGSTLKLLKIYFE